MTLTWPQAMTYVLSLLKWDQGWVSRYVGTTSSDIDRTIRPITFPSCIDRKDSTTCEIESSSSGRTVWSFPSTILLETCSVTFPAIAGRSLANGIPSKAMNVPFFSNCAMMSLLLARIAALPIQWSDKVERRISKMLQDFDRRTNPMQLQLDQSPWHQDGSTLTFLPCARLCGWFDKKVWREQFLKLPLREKCYLTRAVLATGSLTRLLYLSLLVQTRRSPIFNPLSYISLQLLRIHVRWKSVEFCERNEKIQEAPSHGLNMDLYIIRCKWHVVSDSLWIWERNGPHAFISSRGEHLPRGRDLIQQYRSDHALDQVIQPNHSIGHCAWRSRARHSPWKWYFEAMCSYFAVENPFNTFLMSSATATTALDSFPARWTR